MNNLHKKSIKYSAAQLKLPTSIVDNITAQNKLFLNSLSKCFFNNININMKFHPKGFGKLSYYNQLSLGSSKQNSVVDYINCHSDQCLTVNNIHEELHALKDEVRLLRSKFKDMHRENEILREENMQLRDFIDKKHSHTEATIDLLSSSRSNIANEHRYSKTLPDQDEFGSGFNSERNNQKQCKNRSISLSRTERPKFSNTDLIKILSHTLDEDLTTITSPLNTLQMDRNHTEFSYLHSTLESITKRTKLLLGKYQSFLGLRSKNNFKSVPLKL